VRAMKRKKGKEIFIFGGGELAPLSRVMLPWLVSGCARPGRLLRSASYNLRYANSILLATDCSAVSTSAQST
jgi:hypothetical protein